MRKVTVIVGQNIMDIAMQEYGDADAIVELCDMNNLELDDDVYAGQVLLLRDLTESDEVARYYKSKSMMVSSTLSMVTEEVIATGSEEIIVMNNDSLIGI
ncbi:MAG: hypothetical protein P0Y49_15395 [Candidatus Pedobacter colombiensis]|uniref:LysM domain-containing protein n=1 Tax=Candidatus Pedobacter colombiensis TaxID=3121371 RepID=A0AAJ5W6S7_9SPHI|nr:hypothetical protein [Pedobacter sp.]WEK18175.1 MAG: hypothetical protein P0Y49_15395 [Pedobacter sp.]